MIETFFAVKNLDLIIAGILFIAGIVIFIASRIGVLPKRTLPFILAALLGAISVSLLQAFFKKRILAELDKRKRELDERKKELEQRAEDLDKRKSLLDTQSSDLNARLDETDAREVRLAELEAQRDAAWEKVRDLDKQLEMQKAKYIETVTMLDKQARAEIESVRKSNENKSAGELLDSLLSNTNT